MRTRKVASEVGGTWVRGSVLQTLIGHRGWAVEVLGGSEAATYPLDVLCQLCNHCNLSFFICKVGMTPIPFHGIVRKPGNMMHVKN